MQKSGESNFRTGECGLEADRRRKYKNRVQKRSIGACTLSWADIMLYAAENGCLCSFCRAFGKRLQLLQNGFADELLPLCRGMNPVMAEKGSRIPDVEKCGANV